MNRTELGGMARFGVEVDRHLAAEISGWRDREELRSLFETLEAQRSEKAFLNTLAEAIVVRHLDRRGCRLQLEIATPSGRRCDLGIEHRGRRIYAHVKRLDTDRPTRQRMFVSSRLRNLERIARPFVVSIWWADDLTDGQMQEFVRRGGQFILHARVGEEHLVRNRQGGVLGRVRIVAPWEGPHVQLTLGLPSGFVDHTLRIRRLLRRAYGQFMPRATNVLIVGSSHQEDAGEVESALLGAQIERWDAHPARGQRVAYGRDVDGFWHASRHHESAVAVWFLFEPGEGGFHGRMWIRENAALPAETLDSLRELFGADGR